MDAKNALILAAIFMLVFSVSGCNNEKVTEDTLVGKGITLEFQPGAPPSQISEDDVSFDVSVKLDNEGEHDLEPVTYGADGSVKSGDPVSVFLLGVNPNTVGLCNADGCHTEMEYLDGLTGAHYVNNEVVPGQVNYINWIAFDEDGNEVSPYYKLDLTSDQKLKFVAQLCYPYKTLTTAEACFSDNAYAQATGAETCSVSGDKTVSNSEAPVKISKITENPAGKDSEGRGKYSFTFKIQNAMDGTVFPYTKSVSECTNLKVADLNANQIAVTGVYVGGIAKPECLKRVGVDDLGNMEYKPATVTLIKRDLEGDTESTKDDLWEGTFSCTLTQETGSGDYSDIIQIELAYNYYVQATKEITVKNTLDFE
ncbi:hypothetical protein HOD83_02105 [Candidatus Woesearchaeota archaeon]|jgi:hypothetical protein|nr:hypothetical protein [Candidatus Woesearchaeota archaeon]MBT4114657.1 hypothetical protein [Candidatus Woesearchaeota archaeon]MBT4248359.1 hypothetical protein [Candidatus Woesearchaeota archaeon]